MKIQFNTDKTIDGDERTEEYFSEKITKELNRYTSQFSRIEVHLSDENGRKEGMNDIRCLLEARLKSRKPIAVSDQADTPELAVSGAIQKLKAALDTIMGRMQNHH